MQRWHRRPKLLRRSAPFRAPIPADGIGDGFDALRMHANLSSLARRGAWRRCVGGRESQSNDLTLRRRNARPSLASPTPPHPSAPSKEPTITQRTMKSPVCTERHRAAGGWLPLSSRSSAGRVLKFRRRPLRRDRGRRGLARRQFRLPGPQQSLCRHELRGALVLDRHEEFRRLGASRPASFRRHPRPLAVPNGQQPTRYLEARGFTFLPVAEGGDLTVCLVISKDSLKRSSNKRRILSRTSRRRGSILAGSSLSTATIVFLLRPTSAASSA